MSNLLRKLDALVYRLLLPSADREWARLATEEMRRSSLRVAGLTLRVTELIREKAVMTGDLDDRETHIAQLETLLPWLQHDAWRCSYPRRYQDCCCGLDDACDKAGVPRVPRPDNENTNPQETPS